MKRFRLIAGPNGSGKTTLRRQLAADYAVNFYTTLCADDIFAEASRTGAYAPPVSVEEKSLRAFVEASAYGEDVKDAFRCGAVAVLGEVIRFAPEAVTSYTVALVTAFLGAELVRHGASFSMESVFSHPSKLAAIKAAREAGYRTYLYYVATDSADVNVSRVANRVALGGHGVPEEKIRARYARSLAQLPLALPLLSRAYFFDNGGETMRFLGEWDGERQTLKFETAADETPAWFDAAFASVARAAADGTNAQLARSASVASRRAFAEALAAGRSVAVWRGGRVEWIQGGSEGR